MCSYMMQQHAIPTLVTKYGEQGLAYLEIPNLQ